MAKGDPALPGEIDRSLPAPLHQQLQTLIRSRIQSGQWAQDQPIPSEPEMCRRYGVSRTVVRQALHALKDEGLIRRERGRGTFVAATKIAPTFLQQAYGFYQEMQQQGIPTYSQVLESKRVPAPARVASALEIPLNEPVVQLTRLRYLGNAPAVYVVNYLPARLCPGLEQEDLRNRSLYAHLAERHGIFLAAGHRTLEAVPASTELARYLGVTSGSPLLLLESVSRDTAGRWFEYFLGWHRGDRCKFSVELRSGLGSITDTV